MLWTIFSYIYITTDRLFTNYVRKMYKRNIGSALLIGYVNPFAPNVGSIRHVRCDTMKLFVLCDCNPVYILDFLISTEAGTTTESEHKDCGKSGSIVMSLLEPHLRKGHTLYVDNWYASPALFDILHKNFTNACGTIKERRDRIRELKNVENNNVSPPSPSIC